MKTIKKMKYVSPALEVVHIEMEEGIAGTSPGGGAAAPSATPGSNDWGEGTGGTNNGEAW